MYMDQSVLSGPQAKSQSIGIKTVADLRFLYVRPEFRRRGVGTMLVQHIYEHASKHEYLGLIASCDGYTPESERFLQSNGFRLLERVQRGDFWERLFGLRGDKCLYDRSVMPADLDDGEGDWAAEFDTAKPGKASIPNGNLRNRRSKQSEVQNSKYEKLDSSVLKEDKETAMRRMYEYLETSSNQYVDPEEIRGNKGTKNYPFRAGASGLAGEWGRGWRNLSRQTTNFREEACCTGDGFRPSYLARYDSASCEWGESKWYWEWSIHSYKGRSYSYEGRSTANVPRESAARMRFGE